MQRNLTVSYKTETRGGGRPYSPTTYVEVPALCLKGKWLDEFGFGIGTKVVVECQNGQLVIKKQRCLET